MAAATRKRGAVLSAGWDPDPPCPHTRIKHLGPGLFFSLLHQQALCAVVVVDCHLPAYKYPIPRFFFSFFPLFLSPFSLKMINSFKTFSKSPAAPFRLFTRSMASHSVPTLKNPELLQQRAFINGEFVSAKSGETFDVFDPATGNKIGSAPEMSLGELQYAITAANGAFKDLKKTTGRERSHWLRRWYDLMIENKEDLATIITWENGKVLADAQGEVAYAAGFFEWFSEEAPRINGDTISSALPTRRMYTLKQPVGACGIITPWNFPSGMITRKVGAALAAGCPVVVKPASETPFSALALAYLAQKAGIPKGAFNVVTADKATVDFGRELCENPAIKKVSFTGSTRVGKILMTQSASTLKKLSLELGGNAPYIVFEDGDIDAAISSALAAKYRGNGQVCVSPNRFFVQEAIYDDFCKKIAQKVSSLYKPGAGFGTDVNLGPLINAAAVKKVSSHVEDVLAKNGKVLTGGKPLTELGPNFFPATVVSDVTKDMLINSEETFGPLVSIIKFSTEEEVIEKANSVAVGLASYFFTKDVGRAYRVAEALESGMVGVNTGLITEQALPFGGVKESGFGREGSKYGIDEYLTIKAVVVETAV